MIPDQLPVNHVAEQAINMQLTGALVGSVEAQVFPISDARHQLDACQVRECEDGLRLAMGVRVHGVGLHTQAR